MTDQQKLRDQIRADFDIFQIYAIIASAVERDEILASLTAICMLHGQDRASEIHVLLNQLDEALLKAADRLATIRLSPSSEADELPYSEV